MGAELAVVADFEDQPENNLLSRYVSDIPAPIPVSKQMRGLFPSGGLKRGSVVTVVNSATAALTVVAQATQAGMWCAAVGMPELSASAAAGLGVELKRFPLIPDPGKDWPTVVAALVDGFDIILMGTNKALHEGATRRLEARMRQRGTALVLLAPMPNVWHQTDYVIRETSVQYLGLNRGNGFIANRQSVITLEGRGAAARPRTTQLAV